ncbi:hypothetical protein C6499_03195 [Candidatus Poribacteria bacterium]|nr:MAG: hypothetical protein C6499_03195 [Candidatus Poribacteria bacterium]
MRKKKQTTIDKRILKAECLRITPDHCALHFQEELHENFEFRVGFIHQGVVAHVEEIGIPEDLGAHDAAKDIAIPRLSCFIVLVTQAVLHHINRLPTLFKHAVWETVDDILNEDAEIPEVLLVIVANCIEKATGEINYNQLKRESVLNRLWNGIKSAYGEKYAPSDIEIFDSFYDESEEDFEDTE